MRQIPRLITIGIAALGLAAVDGAFAQPKEKEKERKEQGGKPDKEAKERDGRADKPKRQKEHKHQNGKELVGDKIKKNGKHKFHENGKHSASVEVRNGKIAGVTVAHAEKGAVPVKKYKTSKKMAEPAGGIQAVSLTLAQLQHLGTTWIGYAYTDDWGDEVIYWFPYDVIYDGDTGAVEYVPAY